MLWARHLNIASLMDRFLRSQWQRLRVQLMWWRRWWCWGCGFSACCFFFLLSSKSHSYSYIVKGLNACSKKKRKKNERKREMTIKCVTWSSFFPIVLHHKSRNSLWSVYMLTPSQKENKACVFKRIFHYFSVCCRKKWDYLIAWVAKMYYLFLKSYKFHFSCSQCNGLYALSLRAYTVNVPTGSRC